MKAISIKEPWASMILAGKKTIETRKWSTKYRGKLLLCASKNPKSNISGMAFAIADLINVRPMTRGDEKKACCGIYEGAFSWELDNVKKINPFAVKGQLGLFNIDYKGDMGMKQYIAQKDLQYLSNVAGSDTTSTKKVIEELNKLPEAKKRELKKDFDEFNDYILMEYPEFYEAIVEPLKYGVQQGDYDFLKSLMKRF